MLKIIIPYINSFILLITWLYMLSNTNYLLYLNIFRSEEHTSEL